MDHYPSDPTYHQVSSPEKDLQCSYEILSLLFWKLSFVYLFTFYKIFNNHLLTIINGQFIYTLYFDFSTSTFL